MRFNCLSSYLAQLYSAGPWIREKTNEAYSNYKAFNTFKTCKPDLAEYIYKANSPFKDRRACNKNRRIALVMLDALAATE